MKHVGDPFWAQFFAPGSPGDARTIWDGGAKCSTVASRGLRTTSTMSARRRCSISHSGSRSWTAIARGTRTSRIAEVFAQDAHYEDPTRLAVFIDNHDVWRFASDAEAAGALSSEVDQRLDAALTLIYAARGIPVVYYGTENRDARPR